MSHLFVQIFEPMCLANTPMKVMAELGYEPDQIAHLRAVGAI
jgi:hypothetical protein